MFATLTYSITSTLRKTLRFLGMPDNAVKTPSFLKPEADGTDVERYLDDLLNGYNAQGSELMRAYRVKEVNHCKENTDVGHEYVSVKVEAEGSDTEIPFYIVFERFRGLKHQDPTTVPAQAGGTTPTPARERTLSSRSFLAASSGLIQGSSDLALRSTALSKDTSSPSLQDGRANDKASTIYISTKTGKTQELCETITFENEVPLLYQVAVLAVAVHHSQAKYNLNDASCFFYAAAIIELIKKVFPSFIGSVSENSSLKAGYVPGLQRTPFFSVWSANKIEEEALDKIISSYHANLTQFENAAKTISKQLADHAERADREATRARELAAENARLRQQLASQANLGTSA